MADNKKKKRKRKPSPDLSTHKILHSFEILKNITVITSWHNLFLVFSQKITIVEIRLNAFF